MYLKWMFFFLMGDNVGVHAVQPKLKLNITLNFLFDRNLE